MFEALQILTVVLVAIAMALSLAHALEFPGKLRLGKDEYLTVQPIYYPGFTIGGFAEAIGLLVTLLLVFLTPAGSLAFWLTLGAFIALLAMHLLYWLLTHPVNNFWHADFKLRGGVTTGLADRFFSSNPLARTKEAGEESPPDWTVLRDRWEYSHVYRSVLAMLGFILLVTAVAL
jgi:hypothetical protein